jgi:hypothetical protein
LGFRFVRPINAILTKPPSTDQTATSATNWFLAFEGGNIGTVIVSIIQILGR